MEISITSKGNFEKATDYLDRLRHFKIDRILNEYGQKGVDALRAASPRNTGLVATSWSYKITYGSGRAILEWHNADIEGGYNVALLIQYGHGTNNGGYVVPHDFINPAMEPIFEGFARQIGEEVKHI
jgi:hypothetical protein